MKTMLYRSIFTLILGCFILSGYTIASPPLSLTKDKKGPLVHIVLISFKEDVSPGQMARLDSLVRNMKHRIREIKSLSWEKQIGLPNETVEYSHILTLTFKNLEDLRSYDNHPEHLRVLAAALPLKKKLLRFNYYK